jgi:hypothetical protein
MIVNKKPGANNNPMQLTLTLTESMMENGHRTTAPLINPGLQCLDAIYNGNRVRKPTPDRNGIGHMHARSKRSKGVKLNGILECNFSSENANCAVLQWGVAWPLVAKGGWLLEREEHRTLQ